MSGVKINNKIIIATEMAKGGSPTSPATKADVAQIINAFNSLVQEYSRLTATQELKTNHIYELTSGEGVTIEGLIATSPILYTSQGAPSEGVQEATYGDGYRFTTVLQFTDLEIGSPVGASALAFGILLFNFSSDIMAIQAASFSLALTGTTEIVADTPDTGVGSQEATGEVATLDGTPAFEDYITGQTAPDCNGTAFSEATLPTSGNTVILKEADAKTIYLNIANTWTAAGTVTATGTVTITWFKI